MEKLLTNRIPKIEITQLNPAANRQDGVHVLREALGLPFTEEYQILISQEANIVDVFQTLEINKPALQKALEANTPLILTGSELTYSQRYTPQLLANQKAKEYYRRADLYSLKAIEYAKNKGGKVLGICFGFQAIANHLFSSFEESCIMSANKWIVGETVLQIDSSFGDVIAGDYKIRMSLKDILIHKDWSLDSQVGIQGVDNDEMTIKVLQNGPDITLPSTDRLVSLVMGYYIKFKKSKGAILALAGHPELPLNILTELIEQRHNDPLFNMPRTFLELDEKTKNNLPESINIIYQFLFNNAQ